MALRFNDLPQPVRERFVQITTATGIDPRIIVHSKDTGMGWFAYVTAVGSVVAMVAALDFTIGRAQTIDPVHDKEVYLGFAAAVAVLLLSISAIVFRLIWKPPPYAQGMYAFTSYLVRASGGDLELMSLADIGTPTIVTVRRNGGHVHTRLELGGPFTFYYSTDAAAQAGWATIAAARTAFRTMLAARDVPAINAVDPFAECTISGAWSVPHQPPVPPRATSVPTGVKIGRWLASLVVGVVLATVYYGAVDAFFEEDRAIHDLKEKKRLYRR